MNNIEIVALSEQDFDDVAKLESVLQPQDGWKVDDLNQLWQGRDATDFGGIGLMMDGVLVSYLIYQVLDVAEVLRIGTQPTYQGQGLAKRLLTAWLDDIKDLNIDVLLEVRADNHAAIGLYQSLGFELIHIRKHYYANHDGTKTHALIMQKNG